MVGDLKSLFGVTVTVQQTLVYHNYNDNFSSMSGAGSKSEGRREDALAKQREQMREDFERQKQTLISETEKSRPSASRFVGQHDSMEDTLKNSTVGLVRLEEFQQRRKALEEAKAREAARTSDLKYVHSSFDAVLWYRKTRWLIGCGESV